MTETYRRYTVEEDAALLEAYRQPTRALRDAALCRLAGKFDRTIDALYSRSRLLRIRTGEEIQNRRGRRAFTAEEDAMILALPMGSRIERWKDLARRLCRPTSTLKHRKIVLRRSAERKRVQMEARLESTLRSLPVSTPRWFERSITRERLMAGR